MDYQKILDMLIEIEGELDDAYYSLPDYNANSDSQGYIDGARCTLYHLKDEIEKTILDSNIVADGEGRLKGNN
tara:strand:+ start:274 stop:492 length:219 start_codon:yes stop_codon:yes gene_type:complete